MKTKSPIKRSARAVEVRPIQTRFITREEGQKPVIEGYFAIFNSIYEIGDGMSESIKPGAFKDALNNDIRALTNHDSTLVLGRTKSGTLELREDSIGLYGKIYINPGDTDAMNTYERVKRGDVNQCSFGFEIEREETSVLPDGTVHWTITKVNPLFEVSVCTFPAYKETNITARSAQRSQYIKSLETAEAWKFRMKNAHSWLRGQ